jgi:hypothetical protein
MGLASTSSSRGAGRFDAATSKGADAGNSLDPATRGRVQLVCDFVNAEIARWRNQLIGITVACLAGMVIFPIVTGIADARVGVVIVIGICGFWFTRARRELASSYDKLGAKRLVAATNKALTYKPVSSLKREQFVSMDLFPAPEKGLRSGPEIGGRAGDSAFSLHAVHAPGTERGQVVFNGVVVRLDFPASFPGHTVVFPDQGDSFGQLKSSGARRDLVLLKQPEFERVFSAYSTDYMEARQLFTDKFVELVLAANRIFPHIRLAFVRRSLFVAVPGATLLPDVSLLSAPLTPESATGQMARLSVFAAELARAVRP